MHNIVVTVYVLTLLCQDLPLSLPNTAKITMTMIVKIDLLKLHGLTSL